MNRNAKIALGFTLAALLATAAPHAHAQSNNNVKDDLFAGTEQFEKNATEVNEINMDPDTLNIVSGPQAGKAHSMVLNVVRSYTYDKPGMYDMAAVDRFREKLNTGDWRCSVHTRELKTGESTDVCYKRRTDGMREEAIITVEPKELTFIHHIRRENAGGHSDLSEMPMVFGNGFDSAQMAVMAARMEAQTAKLAALGTMPLVRLEGLNNIKPLSEQQLRSIQDSLRNMHLEKLVPPAPPAAPEPPPAPRPEE